MLGHVINKTKHGKVSMLMCQNFSRANFFRTCLLGHRNSRFPLLLDTAKLLSKVAALPPTKPRALLFPISLPMLVMFFLIKKIR